jgi:hypothetical protein
MGREKALLAFLLIAAVFVPACAYIVLPEDLDTQGSTGSEGWSAAVTSVGKSAGGDLHIDLTLRNDTGDWSAMNAAEGRPAVLTSDGRSVNCDTVFVSSGGHRLAPGFQIRGFIAGTKAEPKTQLIYVECEGAEAAPGSRLAVSYNYVTGQYNYYEQDKGRVDTVLDIALDEVAQDLTYPIGRQLSGLVQGPTAPIVAINNVAFSLVEIQRTETGLQFTWQTSNPGEYPTYVHIGSPPVVGEDGILYGYYETPDIVSVPITPAGDKAEWTTEVAVPQDVKGFYIMLAVETGKARLFSYYAVDVADK